MKVNPSIVSPRYGRIHALFSINLYFQSSLTYKNAYRILNKNIEKPKVGGIASAKVIEPISDKKVPPVRSKK